MAIWHVVEDRGGCCCTSIGYYEGNPVDIAFALAGKISHTLVFFEVEAVAITAEDFKKSKCDEVSIAFNAAKYRGEEDTGRFLCHFFIENRPVCIVGSNSNSIHLKRRSYNEEKVRDLESFRKQALSKLTEEERILLGLN